MIMSGFAAFTVSILSSSPGGLALIEILRNRALYFNLRCLWSYDLYGKRTN